MKKEIISLFILIVLCSSVLGVYLPEEEPNKVVFCKKDGNYIICSNSLAKCKSHYSSCKLINIYDIPESSEDSDDPEDDDADDTSDSESSSDIVSNQQDNVISDKPIYLNVNKDDNKIDISAENAFGLLEGAVIKVYKGDTLVKTVENPKASFILPDGNYRFEVEREGYAPSREDISVSKTTISSVDDVDSEGIMHPLETSRLSNDVIIQKQDTHVGSDDDVNLNSITGHVAIDASAEDSGFSTLLYVIIGLLFVSTAIMLFFRFRS